MFFEWLNRTRKKPEQERIKIAMTIALIIAIIIFIVGIFLTFF